MSIFPLASYSGIWSSSIYYPPKKFRKWEMGKREDASLWHSTAACIPECHQCNKEYCLGMDMQPIMSPTKHAILQASDFPSVLQRVLWGPADVGDKGAKRGYSPSQLFFFSLFFFLAYCISSWYLIWKKKSFVFKQIFENHWLRPNFSIFYSTSWDPLTNVFWNSDRPHWPPLTSTPSVQPPKQIILAKPRRLLMICFFFLLLILKICWFKKLSYTRLEWAFSLLFLKIRGTCQTVEF